MLNVSVKKEREVNYCLNIKITPKKPRKIRVFYVNIDGKDIVKSYA